MLLGCNTATCVAARTLQKDWLAVSGWPGRNILGIVAPTVEAATQTPWAVTTPQYPAEVQHRHRRRVRHHPHHRLARLPRGDPQALPQGDGGAADLPGAGAGAIERGAPEATLDAPGAQGVAALLAQTDGAPPHRAILGCTHYPLVEHLFRRHLPAFTRLLSQPEVVADSLEDYLQRHPRYVDGAAGSAPGNAAPPLLLTTGDPARVSATARIFWPDAPAFRHLAV